MEARSFSFQAIDGGSRWKAKRQKGATPGEESFPPEKAQFVATISRASRAKNAAERSTIVFRSASRRLRRLY